MRMAVTGQIMTMSLGVQGGLKAAAAKYGKEPNEADIILGDGVDAEIAARPKEFGNTVEDVIKFRDKIFAVILKRIWKALRFFGRNEMSKMRKERLLQ